MNDKELFTLSLDIGEAIIRSGGEISRAEDTIKRINKTNFNECKVFAIPTFIIAQCGDDIQMRKVSKEELDLSELERLNALSRKICEKNSEEINITKNDENKLFIQALAVIVATASFCIFFGGSIVDALFGAISGLIINFAPYKKIDMPIFTHNLIDSFLAGVLAYLPLFIGININPDKIIIGAIMLLVPGLTVVNAIRDLMSGDPAAGMLELFFAVTNALSIALGIAGAVVIFEWIL